MTELEARAQKKKYRVAKMPMNYVARALEVDETRGFMKAIVDSGKRSNPWRRSSGDRGWRDNGHATTGDDGPPAVSALR